jgi:hypothetical protein
MMATEELSGIFAVTVTTAAGRVVYTEGDRAEVDFWLDQFRQAEQLAQVDVHELTIADAHGVWGSPGA